ncbi:hypothetical protein HXX76_006800 [Chlamydomonas incerta]|uniref:Uncharacterized protein n=1 Tax=Chlamydomonas incerta TaxID=51695 RepID=A0A835T3S4_CHLIN|nr:hypothetical protein HXX76_006800 [Chlamydomonas incerta]|eukprot:KAG2436502.1 hypothetical protein HXX76_006800 [Chlamydomonas incerta]
MESVAPLPGSPCSPGSSFSSSSCNSAASWSSGELSSEGGSVDSILQQLSLGLNFQFRGKPVATSSRLERPAPATRLVVAPGCSAPVQRALFQAPNRSDVDDFFARALPMAELSRFQFN